MKKSIKLWLGLALLSLGLFLVLKPSLAKAAECGLINGAVIPCYCGDTVIGDYTLTENLKGRNGEATCPADGLAIGLRQSGKDAPTLDCANFEIIGTNNTGKGILVNDSRAIRLIKNCKVHDFDYGVYHDGGGNGFILKDSEVYHNRIGVMTIASGDITISKNIIRDNSQTNILLDETPRIEISDNTVSGSQYGLALGYQTAWTNDLSAVWPDGQKVYRNTIENNSVSGVSVMGSYSEFKDNLIRGNKVGLEVVLDRPIYRRWENGGVVNYGYGAKRMNNNVISGNQISGNSEQDFKVSWDQGSIGDQPQGFNNTFSNNNVSGKDVAYYADISGQTFTGLDLAAFVCNHCSNITIRDSKINEIYFGYTTNSLVENVSSAGAFNGITLIQSTGNTFKNIKYGISRRQDIYQDKTSTGNVFIDAGKPTRPIIVLLVGAMATKGAISPAGTTLVPEGGSQQFVITPGSGYQLGTLTLDGVPVATTSLPVSGGKIVYVVSGVQNQMILRPAFVSGVVKDTVTIPPVVPNPPLTSGGSGGGGSSGSNSNPLPTTDLVAPLPALEVKPAIKLAPNSIPARTLLVSTLPISSRGDEVKKLQQYLAKDRSIYPEGIVSGYYGPLTSQAIKRFQAKYGLVEKGQAGSVGPLTLAKLNQLYSEAAPSSVTPPVLNQTVASPTAWQLLLRLINERLRR